MIDLKLGDCLIKLKELEDNSVDSIVTDPPYELGFMGKKWDNSGIAYNKEMWAECLRVLKPGGHLLAFSATRTYHRMAVAIEDAGFQVRDMIEWVYGSGMGKGNVWNKGKKRTSERLNKENDLMVANGYEGWGNVGMKPSHEPIAFCRKPIEKGLTVAKNCLKWGTGGINIDESRVGMGREKAQKQGVSNSLTQVAGRDETNLKEYPEDLGRFPANLIHDNSDEVKECFPETAVSKGGQSGVKKSGLTYSSNWDEKKNSKGCGFGDAGNASRFFKSIIYQAKASKSERNRGCEEIDAQVRVRQGLAGEKKDTVSNNFHPTVKPIALMEYLIKMVTPKGGIVLDPFMGSGSTGVASVENGFSFIGIDLTPEYIEIAKARIENAKNKAEERLF